MRKLSIELSTRCEYVIITVKALIQGVNPLLLTTVMEMNKKSLAALIDAYADAKASRNQHLVNTMVAQLEQALDMVFASEAGGDDVAPDTEASEF